MMVPLTLHDPCTMSLFRLKLDVLQTAPSETVVVLLPEWKTAAKTVLPAFKNFYCINKL